MADIDQCRACHRQWARRDIAAGETATVNVCPGFVCAECRVNGAPIPPDLAEAAPMWSAKDDPELLAQLQAGHEKIRQATTSAGRAIYLEGCVSESV